MAEEKRIYAVAAETISTPQGTVVQVPGRMSAQLGHALSRMRMHRMTDFAMSWVGLRRVKNGFRNDMREFADEAITTIHKSCRDSLELDHVMRLLNRHHIPYFEFRDENPDVYGPGRFITAIATVPVRKRQVEGVLDYLPLFGAGRER
jgi:hypothetical protein